MPAKDRPDMYNISDLVSHTGFTRAALVRLLGYPAIRKWLGGEHSHPLYPIDRLDKFAYLKSQHDRRIAPSALAIAVADLADGELPDGVTPIPRDTETALSPTGDKTPALLADPDALTATARLAGKGFADEVIAALRASNLLPIQEDRLLDRDQVAALLLCKPGSVSRHVPPVRAGAWSYLHVQAHLAKLRHKAEEKASQKQQKRLRASAGVES